MTVIAPAIYDDAIIGETLERRVVPPTLNTASSLWTLGGWLLILPASDVRPVPELQWMVRQVRTWTGWSTRRLADAVGTSHTTIRAVENGRPLVGGHSGDLRQRLAAAHEVIERVYLLANRNVERVTAILDAAPPGRRSPIDELRSGDAAGAYLSALQVLNPSRPGLIVGDHPRRGGATVPLHD